MRLLEWRPAPTRILPIVMYIGVQLLSLAILCLGTVRPFDGRTLDGWEGDRSFWSVENGEIVGRSTAARPLAHSECLVWTGAMPNDFELRCRVRIEGGNSGIHYRSRRVAGMADLAGYQADLDATDTYTGVLYEGLGRGLMSARGERVEWTPEGKRVLARHGSDEALRAVIRSGDWNDYRIEAQGTRLRHWINGVLMSDVTDGDTSRFRAGGLLALQLHEGDPMTVRFKDLEVRPLASAPPASALVVPEGFTVELLASADPSQGSWVCLCFDPLGRAIISPQSGPLLRVSIPGVSRSESGDPWAGEEVECKQLDPDVSGSAQGLCFLGDALFVNSVLDPATRGLWRLRDVDGDGRFEQRARLFTYANDGGEHGPHAVIPGPDGALWMAIGNHTPPPDGAILTQPDAQGRRAPGSPCDFWDEDLPTPRLWDPRGHAVGLLAPGGVILRVDPATGAATIFAGGLRNAYDLCFDAEGELFTYDSDMEWDIGAPWYRAPRIVHVVSGGDYGWRSGSGKWPSWYPDSLPPACDTDVSSPTGMLSGADGGFPEPWRRMLFAADWTYGRVLAVETEPDGAGVRARWMPFISGRPMPVADLAWGPDGAMYLVTGGRGTQSGLYRIRAAAAGSGAADKALPRNSLPAPSESLVAHRDRAPVAEQNRERRREIEAWHRPLSPQDFDAARPAIVDALGRRDRTLAFAARVALEHQPIEAWRELVVGFPEGQARLLGALALARRGNELDARVAAELAAACLAQDADATARRVSEEQCILALRVAQIVLLRHPSVADSAPLQSCGAAAAALGADLRSDARVAQAALELACALRRTDAIAACLDRLDAATDRADAIRWAAMVRLLDDGWTEALRERYWRWLDAADAISGGMSLGGYIEAIRRDATEHVRRPASSPERPPPARARSAVAASTTARVARAWRVADLVDEAPAPDTVAAAPRNLLRGALIYRETSCILCHRFAGEGSSTGPDLTGVASRFSRIDLLRAILEPSAHVSDQYRDSMITTIDGDVIVGRIVHEAPDHLEILTNPMGFERERVERSAVARIEALETSVMPPGLLDTRSRDEVLDLLAYLESGGGIASPSTGAVAPAPPMNPEPGETGSGEVRR